MKGLLIALALALPAAACSHSPNAKLPLPQLTIEQLVSPSTLGYPTGAIDVQYRMSIANRADQPLTLRRLEIQSDNMGGYQLRHETKPFDVGIGPGEVRSVEFWVHAWGVSGARQNAPVTVRGTLYFDTPVGPLHQFFLANISQFGD